MASTRTLQTHLPGLAMIVVLLLAWEYVSRTTGMQSLPAPSAIAVAFGSLALSGEMFWDALHTITTALMGWTIVCVIGITAGVALGSSQLLRSYTLASIEMLRPLPGVAFVPVGLLLFGFSVKTELLVIVIPSLWPVLVNAMGGVQAIHPRLVDVTRMFHFSRQQAFRKVLIPAALPSIVIGCRLSLSMTLVMAIIVEIVGNPAGLGYALVREQQAMAQDRMFAYVFCIGLLGVALNYGILSLSRRLVPETTAGAD